MDVKKLFLQLTKQLVPFRKEDILLPYLPAGIEKDEVGNYRITIGKTKTMFTCHLDSYTDKLTDVVHKIATDSRGEKVGTDGKTPLGADCKAGVTVMLYMIEHNIPGCYYFFIGEEAINGGGCKGSRDILNATPEYFTQFDRCIAFDRHGYDSIITSQRGDVCCSDEFVKELGKHFANNRLNYHKDPTGRYTDSAVFMYTIPEVTNISTGGFHEHTNKEFQNLTHLEKLCQAVINIPWETLPTVREPIKIEKPKRERTSSNRTTGKAFRGKKTYRGSGSLSDMVEDAVGSFVFGNDYVKRKRAHEIEMAKKAEKEYDEYLKSEEYKNKNKPKRPRIKKYNDFNKNRNRDNSGRH